MGSRYLTELADWLREAGLNVIEVDGWQTRARGSGGYDGDRPWCVMWHHTASQTSPGNDVNYICHGCPDAPVANLFLARNGDVHVCAAGATNTNGKGGPVSTSKGTVPLDSMNTHAISIEAGNNGVGEPWPVEQINAYFVINDTLCDRLGLHVIDLFTHQVWAPDRKIDPATAVAVQGGWQPSSVTSSGTWSMTDIRDEAIARSQEPTPPDPTPDPTPPQPGPPAEQEDKMLVVALDRNGTAWVGDGIKRYPIPSEAVFSNMVLVHKGRFLNTSGQQVSGWGNVATVGDDTIEALGRP